MSPSGPPNPFESIPPESSRAPTPTPSPDASTSAFSPRTPSFPSVDSPLLSPGQLPDQSSPPSSRAPSRSFSSAFVSSPLNPNSPATSPYGFSRPRPASRGSIHLSRIASEESQALGSQFSSSQRGSMILYRLAAVDDHGVLLPPHSLSPNQRDSFVSTSGESIWSLSSDSKYPSGPPTMRGGLVPYVYDPSVDDQAATDEEDLLHEPDSIDKPSSLLAARGILNVGVLILLVVSLLALFIAYPVITYVNGNSHNIFLDETGGNTVTVPPSAFALPQLIDPETPDSAKTRTGFDNQDYVLVFSDEFNTDGRSFYPGDDPFWEAVDLWYWATGDLEWYDPRQVYTANGSLHVRMENVVTNGMNYRSGMLQSWNKFCFTSGYIEVSLTLPGPNEETRGYWPGVWTMGNLGRPGYGATTDGTWPYTQVYDSCDVGTFPNQTNPDGLGPAAALHSDASQAKYDFKLSYLTGQKLSACTCPGEDHPGPDVTKGRGAPEIDIFEAEHNKQGNGGVISQSAQFAPFSHDYVYSNDTDQEWYVYNSSISRPNNYKGSAVQQAISGVTQLPADVFEGSGQVFHTFGFEYFANPKSRSDGYIIWQMDNLQTVRMGAGAVGPDQGTDGSGVDQRLIPEEPMSIVLNLGISPNWQTIDLTTMTFPTEMVVDYVRVYQRKDSQNIGCDPPDYPTMDYISRHPEAYTNPQLQFWTPGPAGANYTFPKNRLVRPSHFLFPLLP
ncbi:beta-glucan synthesis-associated [Lactarius hatsudake]|nr:beta-glucan synthesis-associated [Lactarius hatsudake]